MKPVLIIANWKCNKTLNEAKEWLTNFNPNFDSSFKTVVICPPYPYLEAVRLGIEEKKIPVELGAQDVSQFENGGYTGEVNAAQIKDFANYVIIGHCERTKNFNETNQILEQKVNLAIKYNLIPVFCIQGKDTYIPSGVEIVCYDPIFAIGTGNPATPEDADQIGEFIKAKGYKKFLYGGSVNLENAPKLIAMPTIDGFIVGGKSLDPLEFAKIIEIA